MTLLLRRIALTQPIREVERHPGHEISIFTMQDSEDQQPDASARAERREEYRQVAFKSGLRDRGFYWGPESQRAGEKVTVNALVLLATRAKRNILWSPCFASTQANWRTCPPSVAGQLRLIRDRVMSIKFNQPPVRLQRGQFHDSLFRELAALQFPSQAASIKAQSLA